MPLRPGGHMPDTSMTCASRQHQPLSACTCLWASRLSEHGRRVWSTTKRCCSLLTLSKRTWLPCHTGNSLWSCGLLAHIMIWLTNSQYWESYLQTPTHEQPKHACVSLRDARHTLRAIVSMLPSDSHWCRQTVSNTAPRSFSGRMRCFEDHSCSCLYGTCMVGAAADAQGS